MYEKNEDPVEQSLRINILRAERRTGYHDTFKSEDILMANAALARYLNQRKKNENRARAKRAVEQRMHSIKSDENTRHYLTLAKVAIFGGKKNK